MPPYKVPIEGSDLGPVADALNRAGISIQGPHQAGFGSVPSATGTEMWAVVNANDAVSCGETVRRLIPAGNNAAIGEPELLPE